MKVLSNLMGNGSKIKYTEVVCQKDDTTKNIKEYIDESEVYSTSEIKTNKVWIDGKPIYKLSFLVPSFSNSRVSVSTGVTTIDTLVDMKGSFYRSGAALNVNYFSLDNIYIDEYGIKKTTGVFSIATTISGVTFTGNVTIYYTKTTD